MMDDPEVDDIDDPHERRKAANDWIAARRGQIKHHKQMADIDLRKASEAGFLPPQKYLRAVGLCNTVYDELQQTTQRKYDEIVGRDPEQQGTNTATALIIQRHEKRTQRQTP